METCCEHNDHYFCEVFYKASKIIRKYEGFHSKAYKHNNTVWAIGYRHLTWVESKEVISIEKADILLRTDLNEVRYIVENSIYVPLNLNQLNTLISFCFWIGEKSFTESKLVSLLNKGWYSQVPASISKWNTVGGKVNSFLKKRREEESYLWNSNEGI